jgi:serine/threonine protein phosphatase 1
VHLSVSDKEILAFRDELLQSVPRSHIEFIGELLFSQIEGDYLFAHAGVRPGVALDEQSNHDLMTIRNDFISYGGIFEKVIVHGHTPHHPIEIKQNRINADTMAYATQELTAVVLEGNQYRILTS